MRENVDHDHERDDELARCEPTTTGTPAGRTATNSRSWGWPTTGPFLTETLDAWRTATDEWYAAFERTAKATLRGIADTRLKDEIVNRALVMVHAR